MLWAGLAVLPPHHTLRSCSSCLTATHPPTHPPSPPAQAIDEAPAGASKPLFLAYAKYEEEHGLARNAMQVGARGGAGDGVRRLLKNHG